MLLGFTSPEKTKKKKKIIIIGINNLIEKLSTNKKKYIHIYVLNPLVYPTSCTLSFVKQDISVFIGDNPVSSNKNTI